MKDRNLFGKLGDLMVGKGFYIVLFLCVATIGMSGYYLFQTLNDPQEGALSAGGDASVVLPDSEANGPDPEGSLSTAGQSPVEDTTSPVTGPKPDASQPDDPEPAAQPSEATETSVPTAPKALVCTWPVKGELLRDFSVETLALDPTMGDWRTHGGLDIASTLGVDVLAMAAGTVTEVYEDGLMGTTVVINHGDGLTSTYANLNGQATVEPGESVNTGDILGAVGESAIAESGLAPHLHLEVWKDGERVDPMDYLPEL